MRIKLSVFVACLTVGCLFNSCSKMTAPKDAIGTDQKQFSEYLGKLKSEAGVDAPEYMSIAGSYSYSPTSATRDGSSTLLVTEMVSKADNNKVKSYTFVVPGERVLEQDVTLSVGNKEVDNYDDFSYLLFKESEVSNLIDKVADLLKQAEDKAGYGDKAYIASWRIERNDEGEIQMDVTVNNKDGLNVYEIYKIDANGSFVE